MKIAFAVRVGVALVLLVAAARAEVARVELHPFQTTTLTDEEFLTGKKEGKPATIAGALRLPFRSNDRVPAVIIIHGSGGASGNSPDWAAYLNELGFAAFLVDSFTGRGLTSVMSDQSLLPRLAQTIDAYRALELLSKHPRIDPHRIAVMGLSRGGANVLYGSMKRFQRMHLSSTVSFAATIALYPTCATTYLEDGDLADGPIRIFSGSADNYVPVAPCREYVARLRKAGKDVVLTEYPGANHVFDWPALSPPEKLPQPQTTRRCRMHEIEGGRIVEADGAVFTMNHPCVERGVTIGYDEAAYTQVRKAVKEFLTERLHPK